MEEHMVKIKNNLIVPQDRKIIYDDKGRTHKYFKVGDQVLLKVKAKRSSLKLRNYSKMIAHYCGPFEILERIGHVSYKLALPTYMCINNVFHVSLLKKYVPNANNVIDCNLIQVDQEGYFKVQLMCILDQKVKLL
jgi:hypothetical protein